MTKVTLITPTPPDVSAFGVRALSAYLKRHGKDVRVVFLPGSIGNLKEGGNFVYRYDGLILQQIIKLCEGSDIIGISFMTNYFDRALQITKSIKESLGAIVVWGGIHPSTSPEESLEYADAVCIGEGEVSILELVQRFEKNEDYHNIKGLWFKKNNAIIRNELRKSFPDLDNLPFFDYSLSEHYIYDQRAKGIRPLDIETFKNVLPRLPHPDGKLRIAYRTMTDRGCPHKCSYCNISNQKEMYGEMGSRYFRARSVDHSVAELMDIKNRFPFIEAIQFFDDTFFARSVNEIEKFSNQYKEKVGLPFYCQGSPNTITEKKLEYLVNAGMVYVEMGIQTGSERIKRLYNRNESNEKILMATKLISHHLPTILPPDYHIILDNPWETQEDAMDTVKLLMQVHKPYGLCISSLVFFPQTPLYQKAKKEGLIKDEISDVYRKPFYIPPRKTYTNFLIYLLTFQHFPKWLLNLLVNDKVVRFLSQRNLEFVYNFGYSIGEKMRFAIKGIRALYYCDWERIRIYLYKFGANDPLSEGRKK